MFPGTKKAARGLRAAVQRVDELPGSVLPTGIVLTDQVGGIEGQDNAGGNIHNGFLLISDGRLPC